jgi:flagellar hook assembly protein FlgD
MNINTLSPISKYSNIARILLSGAFIVAIVCFGAIFASAQTLNIITKTSTVQIKTTDIDSATVQTTTLTIIKKDKTTQVIALADLLRMTFTVPTGVLDASNTADLGNILGLIKAYPNPASTLSAVEYELSQPATVEAQIVDANGTLIKSMLMGAQATGRHQVQWDATNIVGATVANGSYTCVIRTSGGAMLTQKLIIVR